MSGMEAALPYIAFATTGLSTAATIIGQNQQAAAKEAAAESTAKSLEIQAGQERAAAQKRASEERRQANIATQNLQASAAASGAGASDIGVIDVAQGIVSEGEYRSLMQLYEGEQSARNLQNQASIERTNAKNESGSPLFRAASTILDSGTSYLSKYKRNPSGKLTWGGI